MRARWQVAMQKWRASGPEGKQSAVTIRTDVFGSGAADRSDAAAYFTRLSQSFIASVRLWRRAPHAEGTALVSWMDFTIATFFFFPHHSTFKHLQRDKCVCDPTNAHVHAVTNSATRSLSTSPWCVAYTVQRAHTSHPHWHEHTDMFPSLDLWGSYGDKLSYRTRV